MGIELSSAENELVITATAAATVIVEVIVIDIVIESTKSYFRFMMLLAIVIARNCFYFLECQHYLQWHLDCGWLDIPNSKLLNSSCFFGNYFD